MSSRKENFLLGSFGVQRPTVCVTGAGVGVDSAWEQRKLEARKMLENAAESPASSARFVGTLLTCQTHCLKKILPLMSRQARQPTDKIIARTFQFGNYQKP
jgi:hypothetical protein